MAAIDTNVLVRLVTRDDADQYAKALDFLGRNKPVLITTLSVLEMVWVLMSRYGHGKPMVHKVVKVLLEMRDLKIQQAAVLGNALATWESSQADFADCVILETVKASGATPLATFDRKLGRIDGCLNL